MELWLDTADIKNIQQANELGILHGVTTNPSIFSRASLDADVLIERLLKNQPGLLALQVTRTHNVKEMVAQARQLAEASHRIVVKIPATTTGFAAMSELRKYKVPVLATAISTLSQFTFAAIAGADYAALYLSHMQKVGKNIVAEIETMLQLVDRHQWSVKLMGAAFANATTAQVVMGTGIPSVTLPSEVLSELLVIEPLVMQQIQRFDNDWQQYQENHEADLLRNNEPIHF